MNLGSQILPGPEAGDCVQLILFKYSNKSCFIWNFPSAFAHSGLAYATTSVTFSEYFVFLHVVCCQQFQNIATDFCFRQAHNLKESLFHLFWILD